MQYRTAFLLKWLFVLTAIVPAAVLSAQVTASRVVVDPGKEQGLCVIIGCGAKQSATLAVDIASQSRMLVHGLALDDKALERARKAVTAAGLDGVVTVERLSLKPLPYRNDLANVVVVTDFKSAAESGMTMEEALRVVAPRGRLVVCADGKVTTTVKPMPAAMDEWTHENRGPDGNTLSADKLIRFPIGFRWNAGLPMNIGNPKQSANQWSSTRGLAVCNGRCFTLSSAVLENLAPTYGAVHGVDQYVIARDAFNGLLLWRTKVGATYYGGLFYPNRAPFAVTSNAVYVASGEGKLLALEAGTGRIARTFDTAHPVGKVLVDSGIVVVATWKEGTRVGGYFGVDRRLLDFAIAEGAVEAFDAADGRRLWRIDTLATSIRSADGQLYMIQRAGADKREELSYPGKVKKDGEPDAPPPPDRPAQHVVAVELRTGKLLWEAKVAKEGANEYLGVNAAGMGTVAVAHNNGSRTTVLSAKDGHVMFASSGYAGFLDGALHVGGQKYDPATGQAAGLSPVRLSSTVCTPQHFVNGILINNRGGGFMVDGRSVLYGGVRGACLFGSVPAHGQLYTAQNWCGCTPSQIPGFISCGPIAREPVAEELERAVRPVEGPAYRKIAGPKARPAVADEWPMYRHDESRGNATPGAAPQKLDVIWQQRVTVPPADGAIGFDWKEQLTDPLTAPVIGGGRVLVAASDRNQVVALDAASGKEIWRQVVGGRIDTPPTLCGDVCLFGAHDGYVYALRSDDGYLAWKLSMAPGEERMVSYGKVESSWPVIGTVLVDGGVAYASAGRTQGSDGGLVVRAFDPVTGSIVWSRALVPATNGIGYKDMRMNDLLLKVGDNLQLMIARLEAKSGAPVENPTVVYQKEIEKQRRLAAQKKDKDGKPAAPAGQNDIVAPAEIVPGIGYEGFISGVWPRLGTRRYHSMKFGNVTGTMISWSDSMVCVNGGEGRTIMAYSRDAIGPVDAKAGRWKWSRQMPAGYQVTSVIGCSNAVVVAGGVYNQEKNEALGFVQVSDGKDGKVVCEQTFPVPVAYNGAAIAGGRVYASLADGSLVCLGAKE